MCAAIGRGTLIVIGGHSRGVGKTWLIEQLLGGVRSRPPGVREPRWAAIKISAHRHAPGGVSIPLIEPAHAASPLTQTGRYLQAGADLAFLVRAPDAALPLAAAFIERLRHAGLHVIVESNRILRHIRPDTVFFVVDPAIADWKRSSWDCLRLVAHVPVHLHVKAREQRRGGFS